MHHLSLISNKKLSKEDALQLIKGRWALLTLVAPKAVKHASELREHAIWRLLDSKDRLSNLPKHDTKERQKKPEKKVKPRPQGKGRKKKRRRRPDPKKPKAKRHKGVHLTKEIVSKMSEGKRKKMIELLKQK